MAGPKGPQGKVFKPQLSPEASARIERENRETVTRTINEGMANMPIRRECGKALERLSVLCNKIGVPIIQLDALKKDFAKMMIDEALNGKMFDQSYKQYFNQKLSGLLAAGAKARNDDLFKSVSADGAVNSVFPREMEITDTFERFMQSFSDNMRAYGFRRTNSLPEYGGNDEKGLFDIHMAAHKTLIRDNVQASYEKCSRRGEATVAETCEAARRAVDNAFFYAHAFPQPSAQGVDANAPGMREAGIKESADVIRGLREAHASRSWLWTLRHPIDYMRELWTIRTLKKVMQVRGGLTRAEVAQKLSGPKETYAEVSKSYNEIHDKYSDRKLAEAERELAEDRRQRERQREVASAVTHSQEKIREDGLDKEQVDARARAEFDADIAALEELEEQDKRVPIEIAEEEAEERSEPVQESEAISAPQIDVK